MSGLDELLTSMDFYDAEYQRFVWDMHIVIEGTLHASISYLESQATADLARIEDETKKHRGSEHAETLADEHGEVVAINISQERFVRNMALVALVSRLTHSLRKMARSAESFSHQKKSYGPWGKGEFRLLWIEYEERFGIDFNANRNRIEFVETLRKVRNQIVHNGAEANTYKRIDESDLEGDEDGYLVTDFSRKYPHYVSGDEVGAEVNVSESQLQEAIKSSIKLVGWLAGELRTRELASIAKKSSVQ